MFEWNIFYGLLNFAILAGGLYFAGRKSAAKMYKDYRDKVSGELERAKEAAANAEKLQDNLEALDAAGRSDCDRIIADAKQQAQEFGHSTRREVGYLTIHSILHLLGYDHVDEGPMKRQMRAREEAILAEIELPRK